MVNKDLNQVANHLRSILARSNVQVMSRGITREAKEALILITQNLADDNTSIAHCHVCGQNLALRNGRIVMHDEGHHGAICPYSDPESK